MSRKNTDTQTLALAAAVIFGRGKNVNQIEFSIKVYEALLALRDDYGDDIDEFDLIRALEDLPGFRPRDQLRRIANELNVMERHGEGLLRLKDKLFLDDYQPGDQPASVASVPVDFLRPKIARQENLINNSTDVPNLISRSLKGIKTIFKAAEESGVKPMTPFFEVIKENSASRLSYSGASAATSPFLDVYLYLDDIQTNRSELAETAHQLLDGYAEIWIKNYLKLILGPDVDCDDADRGALMLIDDDDYAGSSRPTTLANAEFISVLIKDQDRRKKAGLSGWPGFKDVIVKLVRFLLYIQNSEGGWPVYRFDLKEFPNAQNPSIPFFSFLAHVGLLDALDVLEGDSIENDIKKAMERYLDLIMSSAQNLSPDMVAWSADFSIDGASNVGDTAANVQACLLLSIVFTEQKESILNMAKKAVRFIGRHWKIHSEKKANIHSISFRPPTVKGPARLPMTWEHPLHAKVVRVLSQAYLMADIDPGFRATKKMEQAVALLGRDCIDGFWMDLNSDTLMNVNTSIICATALLYYQLALEKAHDDPEKS